MGKDKFLILSWDDLFWDTIELARKIRDTRQHFHILVAIARGGWVVGRILSDMLNIKRVGGITISFYEDIDKRKKEPIILQPLNIDIKDKSIILVDDIADTGKTLQKAKDHIEKLGAAEVKTSTLYIKPWCNFIPDFYVKKVDRWVVFPYEYRETIESLISSGYMLEKLVDHGFSRQIIEKVMDNR